MDDKRLLLFIALGVVLLLIWQAWVEDYGAAAPPALSAPTAAPSRPDVPKLPKPSDASVVTPPGQVTSMPASPATKRPGIQVVTDVMNVVIDTVGGDIRELYLLDYPIEAEAPEQPFPLFTNTPANLFITQSGLLSDSPAPDHHAQFMAERTDYRLTDNTDELKVDLRWRGPDGIEVTKSYTFHRNSYEIDLDYKVSNQSTKDWRGRMYGQFQRVVDDSKESAFIYTYTGGVISGPENKYEKIDFSDMEDQDLSRDVKGGWAALLQHYFVGAWIPSQDQVNHYYSDALAGEHYILGVVTPEQHLPVGASATLGMNLFAGPKLQDHLDKVAPNLELTVDYGLLTVLAQPLFWLLKYIHGVVGNWGWAIVILTLLIKLVFYKLSAASYKSMANMRRLQPRIASLKERFGDDRQRMSQALMEMYKTEKINPLGGCLPVLVQIPVFIALYWVLLESVELRQADFVLWLNDLSSPDPYYILPLLMGVTMFIQQKLSPAPPDPLQAKVMMSLPFIFTLFFAFFPSGLVLYWVANNTLSIAQQWYITRKLGIAVT